MIDRNRERKREISRLIDKQSVRDRADKQREVVIDREKNKQSVL